MLISTVLYVVIGIVMTGMVPFKSLNVADPLALAVREAGGSLDWLESMISAAAVIGLAATVLVTFYGQTRIFMRMSSDGMLPDRLGRVSKRFETPTAATVVCAIAGAAVAALLPIDILGDLVSIGTLLSFTIVCAGVLVLRRARPDLERPFRVKCVWLVAPLGIVFAIALMATLPITTWIRLGVWLLIGLVIYFIYARGRTNERMSRLRDAEPTCEPGHLGTARLAAAPPWLDCRRHDLRSRLASECSRGRCRHGRQRSPRERPGKERGRDSRE